jgi:hypothetical protein
MRPEDPISQNYDLSILAAEAIREEEAVKVVNELDRLFANGNASPVATGYGFQGLFLALGSLIKARLYMITTSEMSKPYEDYEHDAVKMVSRVVRLKSECETPQIEDSTVYLIGLMGENQQIVNYGNCSIGVIKTKSDRIEFFRIKKNENLGKMVVSAAIQDPESERIIAQEGYFDNSPISVETISLEERYWAVAEFEKALDALAKTE